VEWDECDINPVRSHRKEAIGARAQQRCEANEPHPVDIHVGLRLRERRIELG